MMSELKMWAEEARTRKALEMATWGPVTVLVDDAVLVNGCFEKDRGWVFNVDLVSDSDNGVTRVTQIPVGAFRMDRQGAAIVARIIGMKWDVNLIPDEDLDELTQHRQQVIADAKDHAGELLREPEFIDWWMYD